MLGDGLYGGTAGAWYDLGSVTLSSSDTTSSLTVTDSGDLPLAVSLTQMTSQTAYDSTGNVASTTDALGRTTTYQYDVMGRQVAKIAPAPGGGNNSQAVTSELYDADGNLVQSIDSLGNSTEYHYSALGQQDLVTQPGTAQGLPQTQVVYDDDGNQSAIIDPDGNVTTWSYNAQGQATGSSQGQVLAAQSGSTTFANLTVTSKPRTFEVYVLLSGSLGSTWQASDNGTLTITSPSAPADPLGSGWQDLGSVALLANDGSTSITLTYSGVSPKRSRWWATATRLTTTRRANLPSKSTATAAPSSSPITPWARKRPRTGMPRSMAVATHREAQRRPFTWVYDEDGRALSASDSNGETTATDSYTYDAAGEVLTETQQIPGLTPTVTLASQYTNGNRTQLGGHDRRDQRFRQQLPVRRPSGSDEPSEPGRADRQRQRRGRAQDGHLQVRPGRRVRRRPPLRVPRFHA